MEQGPYEAKIIEQAYRQRLPIPAKIQNAPELQFGLELFYTAFLELTSCRFIGFGEGPIPFTSVQNWCDVNDLDPEQRSDLLHHVQKMDTAYLNWRAAQNEKK